MIFLTKGNWPFKMATLQNIQKCKVIKVLERIRWVELQFTISGENE